MVGEPEAEGPIGIGEEGPPVSRGEEGVADRVPRGGEGLRGVEVVGQRRPEASEVRPHPLLVGVTFGVAGDDGVADEPPVRGRRRLDRLPREGLLLAVVRLQEEVAERHRVVPALHQGVDHEDVTLRLRDLLAAEVEELVVHPGAHPRVHVEHALALGHLVGVVHTDVVDPARVDVEVGAQVLGRHRGALDVPPGKAASPGRVPLLLSLHAGWRELPQREVGGVPLVIDVLHAAAGLELVEVDAGELGVPRERRHVEVHAVVDDVGVPLLLEGADHGDLLVDVSRRAGDEVGFEAAEPAAVGRPLLCVERGDLARRLTRGRGGELHLVVGVVAIRHEVADVGDVGDVRDLVARRDQHPTQEVREQLAAHVAQRLGRVDGGTARVDPDLGCIEWHERLQPARPRVVEPDLLEPGCRRVGGHPPIIADQPAATGTAW